MAKNYYPNIDTAFNLGVPQQIAWAFPKDSEPWLINRANQFINGIANDGTLKRLLDRYYGTCSASIKMTSRNPWKSG